MSFWLMKHAEYITDIIKLAINAAFVFCFLLYIEAPHWSIYGFTVLTIYLRAISMNINSLSRSINKIKATQNQIIDFYGLDEENE